MTKSIIELAREAGASAYANRHYPDQPYMTFSPEKLEAFATAIKAAHLAELTQGVEMPETLGFMWQHDETGRIGFAEESQRQPWSKGNPRLAIVCDIVTLDQCQQAVAAAVARKDAEIAVQEEEIVALRNAGSALTAERDALRDELERRNSAAEDRRFE